MSTERRLGLRLYYCRILNYKIMRYQTYGLNNGYTTRIDKEFFHTLVAKPKHYILSDLCPSEAEG